MVGEYGQCGELAYLHCPLPLDPGILLTGILSEECSVFKSALAPLRLTFRTAGASRSSLLMFMVSHVQPSSGLFRAVYGLWT